MADHIKKAEQATYDAVQGYAALVAGKPKGYQLTPAEEAKRASLVATAAKHIEAAQQAAEASGDKVAQAKVWAVALELSRFDTMTAPTLVKAKAAAYAVTDALDELELSGLAPSIPFALYRERAAFVIASTEQKRGKLTWADAVGCGAESLWSPCGAASGVNWGLLLLLAAGLFYLARRKG